MENYHEQARDNKKHSWAGHVNASEVHAVTAPDRGIYIIDPQHLEIEQIYLNWFVLGPSI